MTERKVSENPVARQGKKLSKDSIADTHKNSTVQDAEQAIYKLYLRNNPKFGRLPYGEHVRVANLSGLRENGYDAMRKMSQRIRHSRARCIVKVGTWSLNNSQPYGIQGELVFERTPHEKYYDSLPKAWEDGRGKKVWKCFDRLIWIYRNKIIIHKYVRHCSSLELRDDLLRPDLRVKRIHILAHKSNPPIPRMWKEQAVLTSLGLIKFGDHSDPSNIELELSKTRLRELERISPRHRMQKLKEWCWRTSQYAGIMLDKLAHGELRLVRNELGHDSTSILLGKKTYYVHPAIYRKMYPQEPLIPAR